MSAGTVLREARESRGLTLGEAAAHTRVREPYLVALEEDALERLPAPVYARGYLRAYAGYLDLDADSLLASVRTSVREPDRTLPRRSRRLPAWTPALTPGLALAGGMGVLIAGLGLYAQHELALDRAPAHRAAPIVIASPPALPGANASPGVVTGVPRSVVSAASKVTVSLRFTAGVWIDVVVDGRHVYGDAGHFFTAGQAVSFTGKRIDVTSGKGAATQVSVDGEPRGALPDGVTTREYTPQT